MSIVIGQAGSYQAEQAVIGAMLKDSKWHNASRQLSPDDFGDDTLRRVFREVSAMIAEKKQVDLVTFGDQVNMDSRLLDAAVDCVASVPTTINTRAHIEIVKEFSVRRRISSISERLYRAMGDPAVSVSEAVRETRDQLIEIGLTGGADWQPASAVVMSAIDWLEKVQQEEAKPITSGISSLDNGLGGFFPGELTIVGAAPGVGKSIFALEVAMSAAKGGKKPGFCSLEMSAQQLGNRALSKVSGISGMKFRKAEIDAEEWQEVTKAGMEIAEMPMGFTFTARYVEDLAMAVQERVENNELDILIVDYLQLLRTKQRTESERIRVGQISWTLKQIAIDYNIPVIALSQLRRNDPAQESRMPTMRDLRESSNIEADADGIILLHKVKSKSEKCVREEHRQYFDEWASHGYDYIIIKVEKQRQGVTFIVPVLLDAKKMRFLGV